MNIKLRFFGREFFFLKNYSMMFFNKSLILFFGIEYYFCYGLPSDDGKEKRVYLFFLPFWGDQGGYCLQGV